MLALVIAEGVVLLLLALLVAGLLRSHAEILRALHDLGAGVDSTDTPVRRTTAPGRAIEDADNAAHDVVGKDLAGAAAAVSVVGARHDTLLAFLSTGCTTCQPFWDTFRAGSSLPDDTRLLVVVQEAESESRLRELAPPDLEVVASDAAWDAYEVPGSPHFVHVDGPSGRVTGEGTGPDWPAVLALFTQAKADRVARASTTNPPTDVEWRDNPSRIDAELQSAGIATGHPSLSSPPDADLGG